MLQTLLLTNQTKLEVFRSVRKSNLELKIVEPNQISNNLV